MGNTNLFGGRNFGSRSAMGRSIGPKAQNGGMSRSQFIRSVGIAGGAAAAAGLGLGGAARAAGSVYNVYPDTPLGVIQGYVDLGGTVYFHAAKQNGEPGAYDFGGDAVFVGSQGNDVTIIGLPDPAGNKPMIVNGFAAFYNDAYTTSIGVNVVIKNLECSGQFFSSIYFEMLNSMDIDNCRLAPALDAASAIWLVLFSQVNGPLSIRNSELICGSPEADNFNAFAIGYGNFVPTAPAFKIENNRINYYSSDPSIQFAAITCHNNTSNLNIIKNTLRGKGVSALCLFYFPEYVEASNLNISLNDARNFIASSQQVYSGRPFGDGIFGGSVSNSRFQGNSWGPVDPSGVAGLNISGHGNTFTNESFWGSYTGILQAPGLPCVLLTDTTSGNTITALKNGPSPHGFDLCTHILDETNTNPTGYNGSNFIRGIERCAAVPAHVINSFRKKECESLGGTWDGINLVCTLPLQINIDKP